MAQKMAGALQLADSLVWTKPDKDSKSKSSSSAVSGPGAPLGTNQALGQAMSSAASYNKNIQLPAGKKQEGGVVRPPQPALTLNVYLAVSIKDGWSQSADGSIFFLGLSEDSCLPLEPEGDVEEAPSPPTEPPGSPEPAKPRSSKKKSKAEA